MPTFNYCTVDQFRARLRELYRNATRSRAIKIAKYINDLNLTDNQLKNLFNLTNQQLTVFKTKLANQVNLYNTIQSEEGQ